MSARKWCIAIIILSVICLIGGAVSIDVIGRPTVTSTTIMTLSVVSIIVLGVISGFLEE